MIWISPLSRCRYWERWRWGRECRAKYLMDNIIMVILSFDLVATSSLPLIPSVFSECQTDFGLETCLLNQLLQPVARNERLTMHSPASQGTPPPNPEGCRGCQTPEFFSILKIILQDSVYLKVFSSNQDQTSHVAFNSKFHSVLRKSKGQRKLEQLC